MASNARKTLGIVVLSLWVAVFLAAPGRTEADEAAGDSAAGQAASDILATSGVQGGLVVHVGCGDGKLTAALRASAGYLVQGLDTDNTNVETARIHVQSAGLYGKVSVDHFDGTRLPYVDNLVNLIVAEELADLPMEEITRVLSPGGVACIKKDGKWNRTIKPRPDSIDDWTHYLHDASNNAVAHDTVVGPPRRMQWLGSPRYARHHDRMSSVSAVVSAGGRVFYIFDEATPASILAPPKWTVIARDAFSGVILWKRRIGRWHTHLWPLKSGPAQLPRRLVASQDRVYVTLDLDGPLVAMDAATGKTVRTFEGSNATEEAILHDDVLFLLVDEQAGKPEFAGADRLKRAYGAKFWDERARQIMAVGAEDGKLLWSTERRVLPATLAADSERVVFHDGQSVVCLNRVTGDEFWRSEPVERSEEIRSFYLPILVLYDNVVLFSGGETAGLQTGSWYTSGKDTLTALSAETGELLWTAYHPPSGYRSPEDLLVANGLVWTGETTSGRAVGVFTGRDPQTGEIKSEFAPDVDTYWFHHRCYRGKATDNYLLMARTGTEFIDVRNQHWTPHHWFRGACLYGVMPANGLIYGPQHPCACYLETKQYGFNALAPASSGPRIRDDALAKERLQRGPAFGQATDLQSPVEEHQSQWPTYRHDAARSGHTKAAVGAELEFAWQTELGGRLSSPVIAGGKLFVAKIDTHQVCCLDTRSGAPLWSFTAGGRVDSPPTIYRGLAIFGSMDGHVYCLRALDGALVWRFRAAPDDQRLMSFEQVESVWPVHGSVLVQDGVVFCVAGRSMFLDGGLRFLRLDPITGRKLSETVLNSGEAGTDEELEKYVSWLNMPPALPDVLSCDGQLVYMRSQPFDLNGTRLPLEAMPAGTDADRGAPPATQRPEHVHLFSPTGFLDDTWWHRTYWVYGSRFVSGWCGYFLAGKSAPAGRILVFDDSQVYGFGRKPQYYRWTTPIEHQLFTASKVMPESEEAGPAAKETRVSVQKSKSLNPAGKAISVEAWVKADKADGVVLARGGGGMGYTLYLKAGRPSFGVRNSDGFTAASAQARVVGRWAHLTGVLSADEKLQLYVDGELAATTDAPGLLTGDPQEGLEIGADEGSSIGDYNGRSGFSGLIDEVRLYHRALDAAEIARHAGSVEADGDTDLVFAFSFDEGDASDASVNENHGQVEGAVAVQGKSGKAMQFVGGPSRPQGFMVDHHWTADLPLFARGMVLAKDTLFVAGPADSIDEEQAFRDIDKPETREQLIEQAIALEGRKDAMLWAVSAAEGKKLAEYRLKSPPVFDGMIAVEGRLCISTCDGRVVCLARSGE